MQFAVVTPDRTVDEAAETSRRRGIFSRPVGRHRVQDENARLKDENERLHQNLVRTQELNETLSANLSAQILETQAANDENVELRRQLEELREQLEVAKRANVANENVVDFSFKRVTGSEVVAETMPVPQAKLLAEEDEEQGPRVVPGAATALLDRVVPKPVRRALPRTELEVLPRDWTEAQLVPAITPVLPIEVVDTPEVNEEARAWNARESQPGFPVTWGKRAAETLQTNQSSTGTYRVVPLHWRSASEVPF